MIHVLVIALKIAAAVFLYSVFGNIVYRMLEDEDTRMSETGEPPGEFWGALFWPVTAAIFLVFGLIYLPRYLILRIGNKLAARRAKKDMAKGSGVYR